MNTTKNQYFFEIQQNNKEFKNTIKKLIADDRKIKDQTHILECIREFYESLLKKQKTAAEIKSFLSHVNIPKFSEDNEKL